MEIKTMESKKTEAYRINCNGYYLIAVYDWNLSIGYTYDSLTKWGRKFRHLEQTHEKMQAWIDSWQDLASRMNS